MSTFVSSRLIAYEFAGSGTSLACTGTPWFQPSANHATNALSLQHFLMKEALCEQPEEVCVSLGHAGEELTMSPESEASINSNAGHVKAWQHLARVLMFGKYSQQPEGSASEPPESSVALVLSVSKYPADVCAFKRFHDKFKESFQHENLAHLAINKNCQIIEAFREEFSKPFSQHVAEKLASLGVGSLLKHLPREFRQNAQVVRKAIEKNPQAFKFADGPPTYDFDLVEQVVAVDGSMLKYANKPARANPKIVFAAVANYPGAYKFVPFHKAKFQSTDTTSQDLVRLAAAAVAASEAYLKLMPLWMRQDPSVVQSMQSMKLSVM